MSYEPQIGDYFVVRTNGVFGWIIRLGTSSHWNHAGVYIGDGKIVEATPRGVKINSANEYPLMAWNKHEGLTPKQRAGIAIYAESLVGKPYGFVDIARLILRIIGFKLFANTKLMTYLAAKDGYICSELVAESYQKVGINMYQDPADVTPAFLAVRIIYQ
jgi:uncharacterized protein YycO